MRVGMTLEFLEYVHNVGKYKEKSWKPQRKSMKIINIGDGYILQGRQTPNNPTRSRSSKSPVIGFYGPHRSIINPMLIIFCYQRALFYENILSLQKRIRL